jgi:hypothetical protein
MKRLPPFVRSGAVSVLIVLFGAVLAGVSNPLVVDVARAQSVGSGPCALTQPAFCDTFDRPAGTGNRSGQLNGAVWGASRTTGITNFGQRTYDFWSPTSLVGCSGTTAVRADNDIVVCNGQVRESLNDGEDVATLAMYPKQPFDFAGRTGIVAFDVSDDSQGNHAAWPEFWLSDQPVPAPFAHEASYLSVPQNGFGIRFAGYSEGSCPQGSLAYVGVDSAIIVRNHTISDSFQNGGVDLHGLDCVKASSGPNGGLNHFEIHVSQSQIDVYGTDAGTTSPLKHLSSITSANLSFTRGLAWMEDAHYNGNKFNSQGTHTFAWDNFGFDGPVLARDLSFDVPDRAPVGSGPSNLGWDAQPGAPAVLQVPGVTNLAQAAASLLLFNFYHYDAPITFTYAVNGHAHTAAWPYPDTNGFTWRTLALPIPLGDLVAGTNTVSLSGTQEMAVTNVNIVLAGAGGVVPVGGALTPSNTPVSPPSSTPTKQPTSTTGPLPSSTPVPTATSVAAGTCTVDVKVNGVRQSVSRPMSFCTDQ